MLRILILIFTHLAFAAGGFALGIYALPILMAPDAPSSAEVAGLQSQSVYNGQFRRDLADSDFLHWGEGRFTISSKQISFMGSLAPGPDYKLYLAPELALNEEEFLRIKDKSVNVGPVTTFDNFILDIPANINPAEYKAVVVWCETFSEFITAATYQ